MLEFIKKILQSHSGVSSKRVCGVLGWFTIIGILIACTCLSTLAPEMMEMFMICCMTLLGIDSVTGIWKKFEK